MRVFGQTVRVALGIGTVAADTLNAMLVGDETIPENQ